MKKIIIKMLIALMLAFAAFIYYLNSFLLPTKIKALLVSEMEYATGKKVALRTVEFDILRGIVLKDLSIYDDSGVIINIKEISSLILILPIFQKQIFIPVVNVKSPEVYAVRRLDGTVNLSDMIPKNYAPRGDFMIIFYRMNIRNGSVRFTDNALPVPFKKDLNNLNLDLFLSLPKKAVFFMSADMVSETPVKIESSGSYSPGSRHITAEIKWKDLQPKEFAPYYPPSAFIVKDGKIDGILRLDMKPDLLLSDINAAAYGLTGSMNKTGIGMDSKIRASMEYIFSENRFLYSGQVDVKRLDLTGVRLFGNITQIHGLIGFENERIFAENINTNIFNLPVQVKADLVNFTDPVIDIYMTSDLQLERLTKVLKYKFGLRLPVILEGPGRIEVDFQIQKEKPVGLSGHVDMLGSKIKIGKKISLEDVAGQVRFRDDHIEWSEISFLYNKTGYSSSGEVDDLRSPETQLRLSSDNLKLTSRFVLNDKLIEIAEMSGSYFHSKFSLSGDIDIDDPAKMDADLDGLLDIDLKDAEAIAPRYKDALKRLKLSGSVKADFRFTGDPAEFGSWDIEAAVYSPSLSIGGFNPSEIEFVYTQGKGTADIKFMKAAIYGGTLEGSLKADLAAKEFNYSVNADIKDMKIEKLKEDTPFKDKKVSGDIQAKVALSASGSGPKRLTGSGKIFITDGKLWQLNLFKGLGVLIFTSDFSDVVFKSGHCNFTVKDGFVLTDDLALSSGLIDMHGTGKIGFDDTVEAYLKTELSEGAMEESTRKNIAIAVGRYTFIEIKGTLEKPVYKVVPSVSAMVEDFKKIFTDPQY